MASGSLLLSRPCGSRLLETPTGSIYTKNIRGLTVTTQDEHNTYVPASRGPEFLYDIGDKRSISVSQLGTIRYASFTRIARRVERTTITTPSYIVHVICYTPSISLGTTSCDAPI
jgi:hypothetical protein